MLRSLIEAWRRDVVDALKDLEELQVDQGLGRSLYGRNGYSKVQT